MTDILSTLILVVFVFFIFSVDDKIENLKKNGITNISVRFYNGDICGEDPDQKESSLVCVNMFESKVGE